MDQQSTNKLLCEFVPKEFFQDKNIPKQYFRQFGRVKRFIFRPKSHSCTVEYLTENGLLKALEGAGEYEGQIFEVKREYKIVKKKKPPKNPDPDWLDDPDVKAELDAMGGGASLTLSKNYSLRSEAMMVDLPEKTMKEKVPKLKRSWKLDSPLNLSPKKKKAEKSPKIVKLTAEQMELLSIIKQQALTVEEKYRILDARDKIIRIILKHKIKAGPTVGTCPDMCPEKERFMRVTQHQVALYEQETDRRSMNPLLAVKQYSRSSADQESPLPHELRPVSVLQMTMSYLLHNIMDLSESADVNIAEWYHFLWDRTRGIRKDITQQELCSQGSVELVEQCARFHIHCSARLVGEDPSVFDQKINTENLTKCLQTLKYMYHDLQLKGEYCPNEAEFRAYIILLNLHDGNFMWEVQQLRREIQKSPEVQIAIKIYSALDQNNYVQFFKLVNTTSYFNACILMRYFVQVRAAALNRYLKCYSPRMPHTLYPLTELMRILAFESISSTIDFLESSGLVVNTDKTHVILDKNRYSQLSYASYQMERAVNVVESKLQLSVGEAVHGAKLPEKTFENHIPENSFNDSGYLLLDKYLTQADIDSIAEKYSTSKEFGKNISVTSQLNKKESIFKETSSDLFSKRSDSPSLDANVDVFKKKSDSFINADIFKKKIDDPYTMTNVSFSPEQRPKNIFSRLQTDNVFTKPDASKNIFARNTPVTNVFTKTDTINQNIFSSPKENKNMNIFNKSEEKIGFDTIDKPGLSTSNIWKGQSHETHKNIFATALKKDPVYISELQRNYPQQKNIFHTSPPSSLSSNPTKVTTNEFQGPIKPVGGFKFIPPTVSQVIAKPQFSFQPIQNIQSSTFSVKSDDVRNRENLVLEIEQRKKEDFERKLQLQRDIEEKQRALEKEKQRLLLEEQKLQQKRLEDERLAKLREDEENRKREELKKELERKRIEEERKEKERLEELNRKKRLAEIQQTVKQIVNEMLTKVEENIKKEKLLEIARKIRFRLIHKYVSRWQEITLKNKRKRKAMDCSPSWISSKSVKQEAQDLYTNTQALTLKNMKRYRQGKPFEFTLQNDVIPKINMHELVYNTLIKRWSEIDIMLPKNLYWKVSLSVPDKNESTVSLLRIENTLKTYFQWKNRNNTRVFIQQVNVNSMQCVTYCVEKGLSKSTLDSNGLIFIADRITTALYKRIKNHLKNYGKHVKLPVVVILQNYDEDELNLKILIDEGILNDYIIIFDNFTPQNLINLIEEGLLFLSSKIQKPPALEMDTFKSFLDKYLCNDIWKRATSFSKWNSNYKTCLKNPRTAISLYNECLDKLKDIILNKDYYEYAKFPEIFKEFLPSEIPDCLPCDYKYFPKFWTNPKYIKTLERVFIKLKLPLFQDNWPQNNEVELEVVISKYCTKAFKHPEKPFFKIMSILLEEVDPAINFDDIKNVSWINIIETISEEKLAEINFNLIKTEFEGSSIFNQLIVVYDPKILNIYNRTDWFYINNPLIKSHMNYDLIIESENKKKNEERRKSLCNINLDIDLDKALSEIINKKSVKEDVLKFNQEVEDFNYLIKDLEDSISISKKISNKFENTLKGIIYEK